MVMVFQHQTHALCVPTFVVLAVECLPRCVGCFSGRFVPFVAPLSSSFGVHASAFFWVRKLVLSAFRIEQTIFTSKHF